MGPGMQRHVSRALRLVTALTSAFIITACSSPPEAIGGSDFDQFRLPPPCSIPAYTTPAYVRPPDDSIAFGTLAEGAGYEKEDKDSDWTDIASGNLCRGAEKELILLKLPYAQPDPWHIPPRHGYFSVMGGPTPYPIVDTFDSVSDDEFPWRAIAAGNLDKDSFDEVVAIRAGGKSDLVVMKVNSKCADATVLESARIGNPGNSDWVDVTVGNFDGTGNQIAMLKASHSNLFLVRPGGLAVTFISDLDSAPGLEWRKIAAGDLDGDGLDELVVSRHVADGKSPTVLVYKWKDGDFHLLATSTFGNNGNSEWSGMTVGDFNGDKRAAIALTKNAHSNFALFDLVKGNSTLRELATNDLDSVKGQEWRGLTAVDWLGGDQGAAELVAVRAANSGYRADLFVYGDPFHRVQRDTALTDVRGQWDQSSGGTPDQRLAWIRDTHTNLFNFQLAKEDDYLRFVEFLQATRNFCVDNQQLRVAVTFAPVSDLNATPGPNFNCANPVDSTLTPSWDETAGFAGESGLARCKDYREWARVLGRLAQQYPQLVMLGLDDFMKSPDIVTPEYLAETESNLRSQAPWMSLVPTAYSTDFLGDRLPDITRTVDSVVFYFRNDLHGRVLAGADGEASVANFPGEVSFVTGYMPAGRKLQIGIYYGILYANWQPLGQQGTVLYDYSLTQLALTMGAATSSTIGGVTGYPMVVPANLDNPSCPPGSASTDKYCAMRQLYSQF